MGETAIASCRRVVRRLPEYLDGELDPTSDAAIRAHLARCGACAEEAAFEARLLQELRVRLREVRVPPALARRVGSVLRACPH